MIRIKNTELFEDIKNTDKYNFLAFVITPWHMHGAEAAISYLTDCNVVAKGFICIIQHEITGYAIVDNKISQKNSHIKIVYLDKNSNRKLNYYMTKCYFLLRGALTNIRICKEKKFYLISPCQPNINVFLQLNSYKKIDVVNILIDEGLGAYMVEKDWLNFVVTQSNSNFIKKIWIKLHSKIIDPIILRKMEIGKRIYDFQLLKKQDNKLLPNKLSIEYYKHIIRDYAVINLSKEDISYYCNAIIINTQPYFANGLGFFNNEDIILFKNICDSLYQEKFRVVLKLHPRETEFSRYDCMKQYCIVDNYNNLSQESLIANLNIMPLAIISLSSTTLVTAKLFHNIATFSLVNLLDYSEMSSEITYEMNQFKKTFKSMVECPASISELVNTLKSLRGN